MSKNGGSTLCIMFFQITLRLNTPRHIFAEQSLSSWTPIRGDVQVLLIVLPDKNLCLRDHILRTWKFLESLHAFLHGETWTCIYHCSQLAQKPEKRIAGQGCWEQVLRIRFFRVCWTFFCHVGWEIIDLARHSWLIVVKLFQAWDHDERNCCVKDA